MWKYFRHVKILKNAAAYAEMIKIAHTLFALPFAFSAVCFAWAAGATVGAWQVLWIVVAFASARSAAMGFNRIADEKFDALNPRTKDRPICAGQIGMKQAAFFVVGSSALFVFAAWMLNDLCFYLSFPALAWLFFYSYTKRFTALAHFVLGFAIALSPAGAWIALCANLNWGIVLLSCSALFQISGFDLLYAIQDEKFDAENGLFSIPAKYGAKAAENLALLSFLLSCLCLFGVWKYFDCGATFLAAAIIAALIYAAGAALFKKFGLAKIGLVFFYMNVAISVTVLIGALAEAVLKK